MVRCPQIKVLFGVHMQCTREWDDHLTGHAYVANVEQSARMLGREHVKTKHERQLELCLGDTPPEGFK